MAKTALELTTEEWKQYHPAHRKNPGWPPAKRQRAWAQARQAAQILREQFGATRVVVFGSLAHNLWYTERSDIDLAAWGIAPQNYFKAFNAIARASSEFELNLVDPDDCFPSVRESIQQQGVEI